MKGPDDMRVDAGGIGISHICELAWKKGIKIYLSGAQHDTTHTASTGVPHTGALCVRPLPLLSVPAASICDAAERSV